MQETVEQICTHLREHNRAAVKRVVTAIGAEQSLALLKQTLEIEENGGMLTSDGQRRRTPGGVFFQLARAIVPKELYRQVFPPVYELRKARRRRQQAARQNDRTETDIPEPEARQDKPIQQTVAAEPTTESSQSKPTRDAVTKAPPALPMTWEEAKALIAQVIQPPGEARTVKLTLIGRPLKVIPQPACMVVSLKGKAPPSLPKGLPPVPDGSAMTWAAFIANKQWHKVKASLDAHPDDQLIIEGYPLVGKNGVAAVMVTNCKSVLMERAQRE